MIEICKSTYTTTNINVKKSKITSRGSLDEKVEHPIKVNILKFILVAMGISFGKIPIFSIIIKINFQSMTWIRTGT